MKFRVSSTTNQGIPTAALPDIVFMLLFFFMVSTVLRETEVKVKQDIPRAEQLVQLKRKDLVAHLYVGIPKFNALGSEPRIQADGSFIELSGIVAWVEKVRAGLNENEKDQLTVALKVDKAVKMGLITDIQTKLREANARKIIYQSPRKNED